MNINKLPQANQLATDMDQYKKLIELLEDPNKDKNILCFGFEHREYAHEFSLTDHFRTLILIDFLEVTKMKLAKLQKEFEAL